MTEPLERADRPSARVLVVDQAGRVLLFRVEDALDPKPPVWITPGGGIEPGEDVATAAARELYEETGRVVEPGDLLGPVAVCAGDWEFRGTPYYSVDTFFAVRTETFDPVTDFYTELEHDLHVAFRWWHPDELDATEEHVIPAGMAAVVREIAAGHTPADPVELPWLVF